MTNLLVAAAATDAAAEKGGAWFEYAPEGSGKSFRVKMRRAGTSNAAYMKRHSDLTRPWRNAARPGQPPNIPHEKDREIMRQLLADTIVVDWNADDFGQPFTKEALIATFEQVDDFVNWVSATASAAENFRKAEVEAAAGN